MNDSSLVCGLSCVIQEAQQSRLLPSQCREGVSAIATNKKTSQESFTNACRLASPTIPSENIWLLSSLSNCLLKVLTPSLTPNSLPSLSLLKWIVEFTFSAYWIVVLPNSPVLVLLVIQVSAWLIPIQRNNPRAHWLQEHFHLPHCSLTLSHLLCSLLDST